MSRFNGAATRTIFASKTTFDALEVDFGEDTESEDDRLSEMERDTDQDRRVTSLLLRCL
jgi:hypothetical protein